MISWLFYKEFYALEYKWNDTCNHCKNSCRFAFLFFIIFALVTYLFWYSGYRPIWSFLVTNILYLFPTNGTSIKPCIKVFHHPCLMQVISMIPWNITNSSRSFQVMSQTLRLATTTKISNLHVWFSIIQIHITSMSWAASPVSLIEFKLKSTHNHKMKCVNNHVLIQLQNKTLN